MTQLSLRLGILNTVELGITRFADIGVALVILWLFPTDLFGQLATAQAVVAPLLLFFVQPEGVLYRDFALWKAEGASSLASRVHALRLFAWGKTLLALLLAAVISGSHALWAPSFLALIWAFSIALAPQVSGADREFLRLELRLRELSLLSVYQKATIFVATVLVAFFSPAHPLAWLALGAGFSTLSTATLARFSARRVLSAMEATEGQSARPPALKTLTEALRTFSIWNHLSGVIQNVLQTMDLFFLGWLGVPAGTSPMEVGLYAVVLKVANFSLALPMALVNWFSVRLGRSLGHSGEFGPTAGSEKAEVLRRSAALFGASSTLALGLILGAPWIFSLLSRGRWTSDQIQEMTEWLSWILFGAVLFGSGFLASAWLVLRRDVRVFFWRVSLPWLVVSAPIYAWAATSFGPAGLARANVLVGALGLILIFLRTVRA